MACWPVLGLSSNFGREKEATPVNGFGWRFSWLAQWRAVALFHVTQRCGFSFDLRGGSLFQSVIWLMLGVTRKSQGLGERRTSQTSAQCQCLSYLLIFILVFSDCSASYGITVHNTTFAYILCRLWPNYTLLNNVRGQHRNSAAKKVLTLLSRC